MREELKMGNDLSLSYPLRQAIHDTAAAGKQTILLLNRRGNSRALVCVDCRQAPECPRCSVPMTYHSANGRLMCHYCGHSQRAFETCPECGAPIVEVMTARGPWRLCPNPNCPGREKRATRGRGAAAKATEKTTDKKPAAKKTAAAKKATAKKATTKKTATKKPAAKKTATKKATTKRTGKKKADAE